LNAVDPTRLFIDVQTTQQWREKGFFTLTQSQESNITHNDSIMMHLLYDKKMHPEIIGDYDPEHDKLRCPRNKEELAEYLNDKPNHGMPYGFPALQADEYITVSQWLTQGAKGEYYQLIRSYTPSPQEPKVIPTLRPFDDPKVENFYYRFVKIHSTIVHKTHMVFRFDDDVLARFNELFIKPQWREKPHCISYDVKISANPFVAFKQIPARSRYQFLLDNSHYIIMTFIQGPVCRGQMALNVIHDHFWVMFQDPDYDLAVTHPEFIDKEVYNLSLPIEKVDNALLKSFSDEYRERYEHYYT